MMTKHEKLEVQIASLTSNNNDKIKHISSLENDLMAINPLSTVAAFWQLFVLSSCIFGLNGRKVIAYVGTSDGPIQES